ncbi:hypothetical protein DFS33DRAFT_1278625 [Desarmillaria ectypa]|nr:hypothetical protein DFS33DRAFT_1278625 [Desarmillaria ectypa]
MSVYNQIMPAMFDGFNKFYGFSSTHDPLLTVSNKIVRAMKGDLLPLRSSSSPPTFGARSPAVWISPILTTNPSLPPRHEHINTRRVVIIVSNTWWGASRHAGRKDTSSNLIPNQAELRTENPMPNSTPLSRALDRDQCCMLRRLHHILAETAFACSLRTAERINLGRKSEKLPDRRHKSKYQGRANYFQWTGFPIIDLYLLPLPPFFPEPELLEVCPPFLVPPPPGCPPPGVPEAPLMLCRAHVLLFGV